MKKLAAAAFAALVLATGCDGNPDPAPEPTPKTLVIQAPFAEICADPAILIRYEDVHCEQGNADFRWIYVKDDPQWPREIPAVGEQLQLGRGQWARPEHYLRVPREGALFPQR